MDLPGIENRQADWRTCSRNHDCRMVGNPNRPDHCLRHSASGLYGHAGAITWKTVELQPDIKVYNTPEKSLKGEDEQLRSSC